MELQRTEGIHFDTNVFSNGARDPAIRRTLDNIVNRARTRGLRVAYSPIVSIELLSGAARGDAASVSQAQSRLRVLVEACGDQILPAPTDLLLAVARQRTFSGALGSGRVAAMNRSAAEGGADLVRALARRADTCKTAMRDDFESRLARMQREIKKLGDVEERCKFLASRRWANIYYIMAMKQAGASGFEMAASRETGMAAIDANFVAFCELGAVAARDPNFKPRNRRHDCEDTQLLLYAAMGFALVTAERKLVRRVARSIQAHMVWHFDEALESIEALWSGPA